MLADSLVSLGIALGISRDEIVKAERPDSFYIDKRISRHYLRNISVEMIKNVVDNFGASFHIEFGMLDFPPELELDSKTAYEDWFNKVNDLALRYPSENLVATISINKKMLIDKHNIAFGTQNNVLIFIFLKNFENFLSNQNQLSLYSYLFPDPKSRCLVLLGESAVEIRGEYLNIIHLSDQFLYEDVTPKTEDLANSISQLARNTVRWIGFQFPGISPLHLSFIEPSKVGSLDPVQTLVYHHFVLLFMLHTSNVVVLADGKFEFNYATSGSDQTTSVTIDSDYDYNVEIYKTLLEILNWLSNQGSEEKLRFFQTVIVRKIGEKVSIDKFLSYVDAAFKDAKQFYIATIDGKVAKNLDTIQAVSKFVGQTNVEIGAAVDNLTKGLNDAIIAAIGVIVGGLITSLTVGRTTTLVFSILMFAYVFYIIAFQIIFRMLLMWNSYRILSEAAKVHLEEYEPKLGNSRILVLTKSLRQKKSQFTVSFWSTFAVFWMLAIVFFLMATYGPTLFANIGGLQPQTTIP